jgi:hypothetical protein
LHVVICCLSLVYIETFYGYDIIPEITSAGIYEAISIAAGFAVAGILILGRARFSFGYFVGFYFVGCEKSPKPLSVSRFSGQDGI